MDVTTRRDGSQQPCRIICTCVADLRFRPSGRPIRSRRRARGLARVGTPGLKLRPLRTEDLTEVARALQEGEGYTLAKGERLPTLQTVRGRLANYGVDGIHAGLVAGAADGKIKAFLLYVLGDRSSGMFGTDNLIMRLPPSAFPPSGRFLQIYDLWVSPEWRQQRVASALKSALEAVARANDLQMIYTLTEATHTAALRLNAGLGYRAIYTGPMWDEVERVALVKWLPLDDR